MTYSGTLMLVIGVAASRLVFGSRDRIVARARHAGARRRAVADADAQRVGRRLRRRRRAVHPEGPSAPRRCCRSWWRCSLRSRPDSVTNRMMSMFDLQDPTQPRPAGHGANRRGDGRATFRSPVSGPTWFRSSTRSTADPDAVQAMNPHLHNVPLQIAAERGLPALAIWIGVRRRPRLWLCSASSGRSGTDAGRRRPGGHRRHALRRPVREQLRRLRVPDAVPGPRHPSVRRRPPRRCCCQPSRLIARARSSRAPAASTSSSSATRWSTSSSSAA